MAVSKTLYDVLQCHPEASADVLRAAYRALVKKWHPDMPGGDRRRFEEVERAYCTLGDPERRAAYDATIARSQEETPSKPTEPASAAGSSSVIDSDTAEEIARFGLNLFARKVGRDKAEAALDVFDALTRLRGPRR